MALVHATRRKTHKIMVMGVKCGFLYGEIHRNVYIELPHTDPRYGDASVVGMLKKSMYGTRDAAHNWEDKYVSVIVDELGFRRGKASPCLFWHQERNIRLVVHGDDFVPLGSRKDIMWLKEGLGNSGLELKFKGMMGPRDDDGKSMSV